MADEEIIDGMVVDLSDLPDELRQLLPYIREWSIGDDGVRSEKEDAASTEELLAFFRVAWPHLGAINAYLDSVMDAIPQPDAAMVLLPFGECVAELQFVLKERTGRDPVGP